MASATKKKKPVLWKRFYTYLENVYSKDPKKWVSRSTLFDLALHNGYTNSSVWDAIAVLDTKVQIAKIYVNAEESALLGLREGTQFQFLNLSYKEQKKMEADIKWFDEIPEPKDDQKQYYLHLKIRWKAEEGKPENEWRNGVIYFNTPTVGKHYIYFAEQAVPIRYDLYHYEYKDIDGIVHDGGDI